MIIVPVWVVDENKKEYQVLMGSEPRTDAKKEILPKYCVDNIIYAPMIHESGHKFAICTINEQKVPENIKKILNPKS